MNEPVKPVKLWYTGKEIVDEYGIKDFQLFDLLKKGLQAYTKTGKKVVDRASLPKDRRHSLKYYENIAQLEIGAEQTGKVITGKDVWHNRPKRSADEIMQDFRRQYYSQPEEILNDPKGCESISFTLPDGDIGRITAIQKALNFQFKAVDVIKFFKNEESHPLPSEETLNETVDSKIQQEHANPDQKKAVNFFTRKGSDPNCPFPINHKGATRCAIMRLPEKHYFTIDDLIKQWGCNQAYVEYLLETRKPNGERLLDAEYKESPYPLERLEPCAQDRIRRLVVHPFALGEVPPGEIIIMREEVERFEQECGIIKDNGTEPEQAEVQTESRHWIYGHDICLIYDVKDSELWEAVKSGRLTPYTNTDEKIDIDKWKGKWDLHIKETKRILTSIATLAKQQCMTIHDVDIPPESIQFIRKYNKKNFILEARNFNYIKDTDQFKAFLEKLTGDEELHEENQSLALQEISPLKEPAQQKHTLPEQSKSVNFFTKKSSSWDIGYKGKTGNINPIHGISYIVTLLNRPGESFLCKELYQTLSGKVPGKTISESSAIDEGLNIGCNTQPISDYKAKQGYWNQWQKLQDDIDNAEDSPEGDMLKKEIKKKQDELMPYLKKRNFADPNDKKAQANISKRLDTAYKTIREAGLKEMAKHLEDNIKTDDAYGLRYTGDITWEIIIK
jgi:hypothetical protein